MNKVISIEDLYFQYDGVPALENVNLEILQGEFVGIFGPNGGGKTTLLKLMMGLLRPQRGKVLLFGRPPEETRQLVGYVPQAMHFDRDFPISALEVVMMGMLGKLSWLGAYPADAKRKAMVALERVGLAHKAKASFGTLSGGEAQRVLIARAIVDEPGVLLLDEPTANVDVEAEQSIYAQLLELNKKNDDPHGDPRSSNDRRQGGQAPLRPAASDRSKGQRSLRTLRPRALPYPFNVQ